METPKLKDARATIRAFCETQLAEGIPYREQHQQLEPGLLEALFEAGLMGLEIASPHYSRPESALFPEALPFQHLMLLIEESSRVDPSVSVVLHVHNVLFNRLLDRFGNEEQKALWLPLLAQKIVGAFAVTEPDAGSDLSALTLTATRSGDGFVLNGRKRWITSAREAGLFAVFAKIPQDNGAATLGCFLVQRETAGLSVAANTPKLSMRGSSTCELSFEEVFLPASALLGNERSGADIAQYALCMGRAGIAAQMLGVAQGALTLAVRYAEERPAFGERIAQFQGVSFPLAQASTEISLLRVYVYQLAKKVDAGHSILKLMDEANKAKLFASQVAERTASQAVETLGGNGVAEAYDVERFYRNAKVGKIYEGTVNILLRSIAASLTREHLS